MSRTNARKNAFSLLFQLDFFNNEEIDNSKKIFFDENPDIGGGDMDYIVRAVDGTVEHISDIDKIISENLKGWTIERLNKVDLAILRLAVYEMLYDDETPDGIVINEAVEIAKKYSSDQAPGFINGILGKISQR
ncbi:transcription antitermination factor NusB [Anaerotignum faecicola]|nr:transcription antitermination factor NusB [Anaerotignum faecicola]